MISRLAFRPGLVGCLLWCCILVQPLATHAQDRELNLVLAFDVSASVNDNEFALQRDGVASALRSDTVQQAIQAADGGVAIAIIQWSSIQRQAMGLNWTILVTPQDIERYANRVQDMPRRLPGGGTMIHAGLKFAEDTLATAPGAARRHVIDLSGNGRTDDEPALAEQRDRLVSAGVVINALAIEEHKDDLTSYFHSKVIGGAGAFVETAAAFEDFAMAMERKLYREISGVGFVSANPLGKNIVLK